MLHIGDPVSDDGALLKCCCNSRIGRRRGLTTATYAMNRYDVVMMRLTTTILIWYEQAGYLDKLLHISVQFKFAELSSHVFLQQAFSQSLELALPQNCTPRHVERRLPRNLDPKPWKSRTHLASAVRCLDKVSAL